MAATVSINPSSATASPGGGTSPTPLAVEFTGDGTTVGFEVEVAYDTASLDATVSAQNGASCVNNDATGVITLQYTDATLTPIAAGPTTFCNMTFTVGAGVADGTALTLDTRNGLFGDAGGNPVGGSTLNDGVINVVVSPVLPTLSFNPATGSTVTLAGGTNVGDAATASITATADNPVGANTNATVSGCSITGTGAAAFGPAPADISVAPGTGDTLDLTCTRQSTTASATLACSATDSSGTANVSWPISCPAGAIVPVAPAITGSTPADGGTASVGGGTIGGTGVGAISFQASGGAGTGASATTTINCSAVAPVTVTPSITIVGSATSGSVSVSAPLTDAPQTFTNAVTCTVSGGPSDGTTFSFAVAAPAGSNFVAPNVIPANSLWSKIALFGLLGLAGVVAVGFRRLG